MSADDDLLERLRAVPNLNVHDGEVDVDEATKVINVPLPYIVFFSTPGRPRDERQDGAAAGRVLEFSITGVGEDRNQAKWVLDQARAVLDRKRLDGNLIKRSDDNLPIRREDKFTRPGGGPLSYGVDRYGVAI